MPIVKVVTVNLLSDLSLWHRRKSLLLEQLGQEDADLIALQEVALPENPADWLADQLTSYYSQGRPYRTYLCPKTGEYGNKEALAILSRQPVVSHQQISLESQGRVAQRVHAQIDGSPIIFGNVHLFWQPGESPERDRQVERLLEWMMNPSLSTPTVICGDFNGTPETRALQMMRSQYFSAYAVIHQQEPDYTCPTPLKRSKWIQLKSVISYIKLIRLADFRLDWRGTLDYIFINRDVHVMDCQLIFNHPATDRKDIYPSDHFGLSATLEIEK